MRLMCFGNGCVNLCGTSSGHRPVGLAGRRIDKRDRDTATQPLVGDQETRFLLAHSGDTLLGRVRPIPIVDRIQVRQKLHGA